MKLFAWDEPATVLITDDDPIFRELLAFELTKEGYHVLQADNGEKALAICRETPDIDLAIMDIELGRMSGIDVAEKIHPLPVLYVTSHEEQHVMEAALKARPLARMLGYVPKALEINGITLLVRAAVSLAREVRAKERIMESTARALEAERLRIAQELHDELTQVLVSIDYYAKHIEDSNVPVAIKQTAKQIHARIATIHDSVQRIIERLRPEVIDTLGVRGAIESIVAGWRRQLVNTSFSLSMEGNIDDIDRDISTTLYRIVQECLTNVVKYAKATKVNISIVLLNDGIRIKGREGDRIHIVVSDNGIGFDTKKVKAGHGIDGIRHRATALGGAFHIESLSKRGTKVTIELPLKVSG